MSVGVEATQSRSPRCAVLLSGISHRALAAALIGLMAGFPVRAQQLPTGGTVTSGSAAIVQPNANTLNINQSTNQAIINWQSFSVGTGATVNFNQPSAASSTLNRVIGTSASMIDGVIRAPGTVILVNPNGIAITKNGRIDVGSFAASTLNIKDSDYLAGNYKFTGNGGSAAVLNAGRINVSDGGFAALLGGQVTNSGAITARLGKVGLGAGEMVTLDFAGDGFLSVAVPSSQLGNLVDPNGALVTNSGRIRANGGTVMLSAATAHNVLRDAVNVPGSIRANSVGTHNGKIVLGGGAGGKVSVTGKLAASGINRKNPGKSVAGGSIDVWGAEVSIGGKIDVSGKTGGTVKMQAGQLLNVYGTVGATGGFGIGGTIGLTGADVSVSGGLIASGATGGIVNTYATGTLSIAGTLAATGYVGVGGTITATASDLVKLAGAKLDASGATGGGKILIGGGYQGTGSLAHALNVVVDASSVIRADARLRGDGGTVIVWSDGKTQVAGSISAVGAGGGKGGLIETSGHDLDISGIRVKAGAGGKWLLDPEDLTVDAAAYTAINNALASTTDVELKTTATTASGFGTASAGNGDIILTDQGSISWSTTATLTLNAYRHIVLNTSSDIAIAGGGTLAMTSGNGSPGGGNIYFNSKNIVIFVNGQLAMTTIGGDYLLGTHNISFLGGAGVGAGLTINGNVYTLLYDMTSGANSVTSINNNLSGNYALATNLDAGGVGDWSPYTVGFFSGTLAGLGHSISNLTNTTGGLIFVATNTVRDISLVNANVSGAGELGALAGRLDGGTVFNASVIDGTVTGSATSIGGLIGTMINNGTVSQSSSSATVSAPTSAGSVGGLIGSASGTVTQSYATGSVTAAAGSGVGGLIGSNTATVTQSYATGAVTGNLSTGGLIGQSFGGSVTSSYATGNVTGDVTQTGTGGLIGTAFQTNVSQSYATGNVVGGGDTGGLAGGFQQATIDTSFATGSVNGTSIVGGLVGRLNSSATVRDSWAGGAVTGTDSLGNVGGLVGLNFNSTLLRTYATGAVTGADSVGGLVGGNFGNIDKSYATGRVTVTNPTGSAGGLIGFNIDLSGGLGTGGNVSDSFWDSYSTNRANGIGLLASGNVTNLTAVTSDPSQSGAANYAFTQGAYGNFASVGGITAVGTDWIMIDGQTRPFLVSEYSTTITNAHQLQLMSRDLTASYKIANNIDASSTNGTTNPSGMWTTAGFSPVGTETAGSEFTGSLNGQSFTVSGLTINRSSTSGVGVFGAVNNAGSRVANVTLSGVNVTGGSEAGALVGYLKAGTVQSAASDGTVTGTQGVGGLVGYTDAGTTIQQSNSSAAVNATAYLGGLVGYSHGLIDQSYASGIVTGPNILGGLVGSNAGTITNSYSIGFVNGSGSSVGGLVGLQQGVGSSISGSFASGTVFGGSNVGGLVGWLTSGTITNSYSANAAVNGTTDVGGLVGNTSNGTSIGNSYSQSTVTGTTAVGGLVGLNFASISGSYAEGAVTGKTSVGGLVGINSDPAATITQSRASGTVTGTAGGSGVGGLVGFNIGSVTQSYADGVVAGSATSNNVGGLVGANSVGTVDQSYAIGSVTGGTNVGGLVGNNANNGTVSRSFAQGAVSGVNQVGGLVGLNNTGSTITQSTALGAVTGTGTDAGGLVGQNTGAVDNSYATNKVTGAENVGGFVGNNSGTVTLSYATGNVTSTTFSANWGAFAGVNTGTVTNSFYDSSTSGGINPFGLGSTSTTGLTELSVFSGPDPYTSANYIASGFDFINTWIIVKDANGVEVTRPFLRAEYSPLINGTHAINNSHQLQLMSMDLNGNYTIARHIDANDTNAGANLSGMWSGFGFVPVGNASTPFAGSVIGANSTIQTISGLTINASSSSNVGLFGQNNGSVFLIGLEGGSITGGGDNVGAIAGQNNGAIGSVWSSATVSGGDNTGGLVGINGFGATLAFAYNLGTVTGNANVGGIAGTNNGTIDQVYTAGLINGGAVTGALVGNNNGPLTKAYWDINTSGVNTDLGSNSSVTLSDFTVSSAPGAPNSAFSRASYGTLDFNLFWYMVDGQTRPFQRAEWSTTIANSHQLQLMNIATSASYKLANNVNASDTAPPFGGTASMWTSAGFSPVGFGSFTGRLDGQTNKISGLFINRPSEDNIGLFSGLTFGSVVKNLGFENATITGNNAVGTVAGQSVGTVSNVYATGDCICGGSVTGTAEVGGLIGRNLGGISDSYAKLTVTGSGNSVGGLVGDQVFVGFAGSITNSYFDGRVVGNGLSSANIGGLVGTLNPGTTVTNSYSKGSVDGVASVGGLVGFSSGTITGSYSTAAVNGNNVGGQFTGGLVGYNTGAIVESYATGNVNGGVSAGGLVGINDATGTLTRVYATGAAKGDAGSTEIGGLVGSNSGAIVDSYAGGAAVGGDMVGGLVGKNYGSGTITTSYSSAFTALATGSSGSLIGSLIGQNDGTITNSVPYTGPIAALQAGWDTSVWGLIPNTSLPYLKWRFPTGPTVISGNVSGFSGANNGGQQIGLALGGTLYAGNAYSNNSGNYIFMVDQQAAGVAALTWLSNSSVTGGASAFGNAVSTLAATAAPAFPQGHASGLDLSPNRVLTLADASFTTFSGIAGMMSNATAAQSANPLQQQLFNAGLNPNLIRFQVCGCTDVEFVSSNVTFAIRSAASTLSFDVPLGSFAPPRDLQITSAGTVTFDATVTALRDITVSATNAITVNAAMDSGRDISLTAANAATVNDTVTSGRDVTIASTADAVAVNQVVTADRNALITAGTDVTIGNNGKVVAGGTGNAIVLAATGATGKFINNRGSDALSASNGRWLVYSSDPVANTYGPVGNVLSSGNTAIWNATYSPGTVPADSGNTAGNRYLFKFQPTLTFTTTNVTKTYGDNATTDVAAAYTPGALMLAEPSGAYLADSAANVYGTSAPTVTSLGSGTAATVGGYAITATAIGLTALNGYAFAFNNIGTLTVNQKNLTVTANNQTKVYGNTFAFTGTEFSTPAGGLINGNTITSVTLASGGAAAGATVAGGPYTITASNAVGTGLGNYNISYAGGLLSVTPATLTYLAAPASRVSGTPNPVFTGTVTGFVNGETQASATTGALLWTSPANVSSTTGNYAITGAGLTANNGNYVFVQAPGNATALTITAPNNGTPPSQVNPPSNNPQNPGVNITFQNTPGPTNISFTSGNAPRFGATQTNVNTAGNPDTARATNNGFTYLPISVFDANQYSQFQLPDFAGRAGEAAVFTMIARAAQSGNAADFMIDGFWTGNDAGWAKGSDGKPVAGRVTFSNGAGTNVSPTESNGFPLEPGRTDVLAMLGNGPVILGGAGAWLLAIKPSDDGKGIIANDPITGRQVLLGYDAGTKTVGGVIGIFDDNSKSFVSLSDAAATQQAGAPALTADRLAPLNNFAATTFFAVTVK